jgi:methylmalonyl-CoA mutase
MSVDGGVEGGLDEPTQLEPEQGSLDLASPEDAWTIADWEKGAAAVLRKARRLGDEDPDELVWKKLTRTTLDGIAVPPLGTRSLLEDVQTSGRPGRQGDWDVRALVHVDAADQVARAHAELLADLDGGVTSLWLRTAPDTDLDALLADVLVDLAPVVLDGGDPAAFLAWADGRELHPGTNLGVRAADASAAVARQALEAGVLAFVVDAAAVHDGGASEVQELAWSMAAGAGYLRTLTEAGLSVDEAARLVEFRYAATDEQLTTIAKLRAARRLWARVLELSGESMGVEGRLQRQHAVTSRPMMTRYDPYVNLLRTTVAAFAAGVGGADAVTVLPFDSPLGRPDELGRRIARNTSHLLIDEAHVAHVADPAGGAYAVEKLTDDLALAAWELFGRVDDGESLDEAIAATVAKRDAEVARRKRPITGLSEFPKAAEALPERAPYAGWEGVRPYGAAFEALRDDPAPAPVFLATLGTVAQHTARATFATNLLAAGGVAVDLAGPTADAGDVVAAYAGQIVVCLAGSDSTYAEWGAEAVAALREAGAQHVIIAGKPTDYVDDSCALGVDALDFLTRTRRVLGARGTSSIEGEELS